MNPMVSLNTCRLSLSARRAWIEMLSEVFFVSAFDVSLSARRAWIEITDH